MIGLSFGGSVCIVTRAPAIVDNTLQVRKRERGVLNSSFENDQ